MKKVLTLVGCDTVTTCSQAQHTKLHFIFVLYTCITLTTRSVELKHELNWKEMPTHRVCS